jgi:hypothetical protein
MGAFVLRTSSMNVSIVCTTTGSSGIDTEIMISVACVRVFFSYSKLCTRI